MPKGPRGEKRPADVVANAVHVMKIATGEIEEELKEPSGRVRSGKVGAKARVDSLSKEERRAIAEKAANVRWKK